MKKILLSILMLTMMIAQPVMASVSERTLGDKDAPVTVEVFMSFQCYFCRNWFIDNLPLLAEEYIDRGLVKFVFRHYPLSQIFEHSFNAAVAAECAGYQGQFYEYADMLMAGNIEEEYLFGYATMLGLDMDKFENCYNGEVAASMVNSDVEYAESKGVHGTPSFFIGGMRLIYYFPIENIYAAIEYVLLTNGLVPFGQDNRGLALR